jgi:hypothetical protein
MKFVRTFGDLAKLNPHVQVLAAGGKRQIFASNERRRRQYGGREIRDKEMGHGRACGKDPARLMLST